MSTTSAIPVQFTSEATARIAQLGIEREVQTMIEHTKQIISGLESIEVETWDDEFEPGEPHLTIVAWRPGECQSVEDLQPMDGWYDWFSRSLGPDVRRWFSFDLLYRDTHGR
jgi:hypothetical protein